MPNSHRASIISNPLFIIEAESMVTFAPIDQFGWFNASARVTPYSSSFGRVRNGPPDAVRINLSTDSGSSPTRHWNIAECSESTGTSLDPYCLTSLVISSPATTRVSLLASAIVFPALMALIVGASPLYPTMAVTTMSTSSAAAASAIAC